MSIVNVKKNDIKIDPDHILDIKTVQSIAIKILCEALKELLTDSSLIFDNDGIKLIAMDSTKSVLIFLKLDSSKFESYYCKERIKIGLNFLNLFKLIKTINNTDTITFFIHKNDTNKLGIKIINNEKNIETIYYLNLLDINNDEISIPPAEFETELTMPSQDFQKLIRDMTNIGEKIEIKSVGNSLILTCEGDFACQETLLCETQNGLNFSKITGPEKPIQGIFSLKYLSLFTKCTNLCNIIHVYIKNDYTLIIRYDVANLGNIKLCLAPKVN